MKCTELYNGQLYTQQRKIRYTQLLKEKQRKKIHTWENFKQPRLSKFVPDPQKLKLTIVNQTKRARSSKAKALIKCKKKLYLDFNSAFFQFQFT